MSFMKYSLAKIEDYSFEYQSSLFNSYLQYSQEAAPVKHDRVEESAMMSIHSVMLANSLE
jgi:hypothetical protein